MRAAKMTFKTMPLTVVEKTKKLRAERKKTVLGNSADIRRTLTGGKLLSRAIQKLPRLPLRTLRAD